MLRECAAPAPAAPAGGGADVGQSIAESLGGGPLAIRSAVKAAVWIMRCRTDEPSCRPAVNRRNPPHDKPNGAD